MRVEDQALERLVRIALGRRDALHDRFEDFGDARPILGGGQKDLFARDREDALELLDHHVHLCRRQVDLVEHRDDRQVLLHRQVDVGERLRLDTLGGVDDEDGALTGLQAAADFVAEVDVSGRVDQVEAVDQAIFGQVLEPDCASLDRDAVLALEIHRVEHLGGHLARVDGVGALEQPIRQRGLAVVDVRDDAEVAQALLGNAVGHATEFSGAELRAEQGRCQTSRAASRPRRKLRRPAPS